jgi:hypothetical protein
MYISEIIRQLEIIDDRAKLAIKDIQEAQERLRKLQIEYGARLDYLKRQHNAEGCQLAIDKTWDLCETPKGKK